MDPERWQRIERIFQDALERKPDERTSFLELACGDDSSLREKIDALLRSHEFLAVGGHIQAEPQWDRE